jgi:anthranilate phosphoribosyltransferase
LLAGQDLNTADTAWAMDRIMSGEAADAQIAGFLVALRAKGETVEEITGLVEAMYAHAKPLDIPGPAVDIVGTGGDRAKTVNISTMSAIVIAGTGAKVVKHGNRASSSASGSSDVLEKLGINLDLPTEQVARVADEAGITFCFAAKFHPAMRHTALARRDLGVPTAFNILGPLTNPAGAPNILMGVFHPDLVGIQVRVLQRLGAQHALVVWGRDNMDEVSLGAGTLVGELVNGEIREYEIHPEDFGLHMVHTRNLKVANAEESKAKVMEALRGEPGPATDIVALNAGAALYAAGVAASIEEGLAKARAAIASGAALAKLEQFVQVTRQLGANN